MGTVNATFHVPKYIEQGILNGTYERVGGVIREANSKQVVAWLREGGAAGKVLESVLQNVGAVSSILNLAVSTRYMFGIRPKRGHFKYMRKSGRVFCHYLTEKHQIT